MLAITDVPAFFSFVMFPSPNIPEQLTRPGNALDASPEEFRRPSGLCRLGKMPCHLTCVGKTNNRLPRQIGL
jgi:hypothetical protein